MVKEPLSGPVLSLWKAISGV